MMKRILYLSLVFILTISLLGCTHVDSENYSSLVNERNEIISSLEKERDERSDVLKRIESEYSVIESTYKELSKDKDIESIFKRANNYSVRANVKLDITLYKQQFFFPIAEEKRVGSGFIFYIDSYYAYVLTSSKLFEGDFNQASITIQDAFLSEHSASIYKINSEYGLAVLEFRLNTENDLFDIKIRSTDAVNLETAVSVHSESTGGSNHISISKIESSDETLKNNNMFKMEVDSIDNAIGSMVTDKDGNLIGIVSSYLEDEDSLYLIAYDNNQIIAFLKTIGMIS